MNYQKIICFFCEPYSIDTHKSIESAIEKHVYQPESPWGFIYRKIRSGFIHADYIEKHIIKERITDPFGTQVEYERILYNSVEFILQISTPNILILQPPRTYKRLINQLAEFTNYSIAITTKNVNLHGWAEEIYNIGFKGELTQLNIDPVKFSEDTIGKITLTGSKELIETCQKIVGSSTFFLKNVNIKFQPKSDVSEVELFSNGKMSFKHPVELTVVSQFLNAYCKILST